LTAPSDRDIRRPDIQRSSRRLQMPKSSTGFKVKAVLVGVAVILVLILYSYFIPDTIRTRINDAQLTMVDGYFMIATDDRPLVNHDAKYRFKFDSGNIQNEAIRMKGKEVMIRKYGWRIPIFSMYENVVSLKQIE